MERVSVESSTLVSVGYDLTNETLELEFRDGVYQYFGVSPDVHEELMNAESKGSYFNRYIRDKYSCSRVA